MIEEVADFITVHHPELTQFGVLSTIGTQRTGIYQKALEKRGMEVTLLDGETQALVHTAIYDPGFGIKSRSNPVTDLAMDHLFEGIHYLQGQGVDGIILGCTEISMALDGRMVSEVELIDPTRILAAALIREATS
jgi:aspartate racemase